MFDLCRSEISWMPPAARSWRPSCGRAGGGRATVLGRARTRSVQPRVRSTTRAAVPPATRARVTRLLASGRRDRTAFRLAHRALRRAAVPAATGRATFRRHQDGNTPLIFRPARFRRISVVIFLSRQSEDPSARHLRRRIARVSRPYPDYQVRCRSRPHRNAPRLRAETRTGTPVTHGEADHDRVLYPSAPAARRARPGGVNGSASMSRGLSRHQDADGRHRVTPRPAMTKSVILM